MTDFNDPVSRLALIERVGAEEYTRQVVKHVRNTTVGFVNGRRIHIVGSRFGRLFAIEGTNRAFASREDAETFASELPGNLDGLIGEYHLWLEKNGRTDLGSADEHLFDESLTDDQRAWLKDFNARWESAQQ